MNKHLKNLEQTYKCWTIYFLYVDCHGLSTIWYKNRLNKVIKDKMERNQIKDVNETATSHRHAKTSGFLLPQNWREAAENRGYQRDIHTTLLPVSGLTNPVMIIHNCSIFSCRQHSEISAQCTNTDEYLIVCTHYKYSYSVCTQYNYSTLYINTRITTIPTMCVYTQELELSILWVYTQELEPSLLCVHTRITTIPTLCVHTRNISTVYVPTITILTLCVHTRITSIPTLCVYTPELELSLLCVHTRTRAIPTLYYTPELEYPNSVYTLE